MPIREEKIIACILVKWTCDYALAPLDDVHVFVNPSPADRMQGPPGWVRMPNGTVLCPEHKPGGMAFLGRAEDGSDDDIPF